MQYSIRRFSANEWEQYKAIRLEALSLEPGMFGNSHALEAAFTDQEWQEGLSGEGRYRFGLHAGDELIGLTAFVISQDNLTEAYMTQSYIKKEHRGKGLSRLLYDTRLASARDLGIKRLIIGHRESNIASKAANQRYGFKYTHSESRLWPDGTTEDMCYYELLL
jgi:RimJ/RimL family protein N-acetyltransferase